METRVVNQMFRLGNEDTVFLNFCFDSKVKVSWRNSNLMLEGDWLVDIANIISDTILMITKFSVLVVC